MKLTGSDRPTGSDLSGLPRGNLATPCMETIARYPGGASGTRYRHRQHTPRTSIHPDRPSEMDWTTWWLWRGARTRSLPELGRENPQRPWYCVLRHGRVGRRQVFQSIPDNKQTTAGWSSPVARQAHNLKVTGSNPVPATKQYNGLPSGRPFLFGAVPE